MNQSPLQEQQVPLSHLSSPPPLYETVSLGLPGPPIWPGTCHVVQAGLTSAGIKGTEPHHAQPLISLYHSET